MAVKWGKCCLKCDTATCLLIVGSVFLPFSPLFDDNNLLFLLESHAVNEEKLKKSGSYLRDKYSEAVNVCMLCHLMFCSTCRKHD